ncbi:aerobic respiration control sensor protein arcB [Xylariales sp. PMI_506]|nr:aerobic respiration control sensor protein arcB [Xylariales sp. PMI_506]
MDVDVDVDVDKLNSVKEFDSLSITEVLNQDSRPTFVIDLDPDKDIPANADTVEPIFCNSALGLHERLLEIVLGQAANKADRDPITGSNYGDFKAWSTGVTKFDDSKDVFPLSFLYADMLWTGSTVRKRWRLISGNLWNPGIPVRELSVISGATGDDSRAPSERSSKKRSVAPTVPSVANTAVTTVPSAKPQPAVAVKTSAAASSNSTGGSSQSKRLALAAPEKAVADWTVPNPKGILSPHVAFARTVNWEATPLGPMDKWSPEFRQIANLVMSNPHPAALFWGEDLTMFYNEAYATEVAGRKHPSLMGTGFSGPFSELWDAVAGIFAECARTGVSIRKEDDYLPIERRGFVEETFYSWSWTPLYGGTSRILGFYNAPFETTQAVLNARRMHTINKVGGNVSRAKSVKQFWRLLIEALEDNHYDVPFALLYSVSDSEDGDQSSTSSGSTMSLKSCYFEGSLGIPEGHIAAPHQLDLKRSREGFVPAFREAMRTREPTLLHTRDGSLPEDLLEGIEWRGFGDPCNSAIIFPVRPTNGDMVLAFLLLGVNPRRPYDDGYKAFTSMLNRQLATSLASFMLYEEEVRRSRDAAEAAALASEQLTQQLAVQTSRLRRMAELSPLGMVLISPDGVIREANDRYYEMTGHPRDDAYAMSWLEQIEEGSVKTVEDGWNKILVDHISWTSELQLKRLGAKPVDLDGEDIEYWVLVNAQPEFAPDGSIRSILGSLTDISHLKWAQGLQNRRLREAEETRRQQNEFIDITSHEMRNPLSAILQCADDIMATLDVYRGEGNPPSSQAVDSCLDAAHTILLCVQHQKSIVDDILTVSKLDSNLLVITPAAAQPIDVVKRAVKMFEPEIQAKDIEMSCVADASFEELGVDWMYFDQSRILQILINLITNAIKFTAGAPKRAITVSLEVSREPPLIPSTPNFQYIPPKTINTSMILSDEWGSGELLYLRLEVKDTGCGLTPEEVKVLFERFSQASPRTHAQYGGSGLGLFISRQLAELHGGQIGVASQAGEGSCFGCFVTARRCPPPASGSRPDESAAALERDLVGQQNLSQPIVPQRQDLASTASPAGDLVAAKAVPVFDHRSLEVLVVEDNLVNQNVLVKQLKKNGIGVSAANDGLEALEFLRETSFFKLGGRTLSVILMDLEMPNMDGLTCVREIRKLEELGVIDRHVPVIAVTANVRDEQIAVAKRSGMDDVVSKPFRIPDLITKIKNLLAAVASGEIPQASENLI